MRLFRIKIPNICLHILEEKENANEAVNIALSDFEDTLKTFGSKTGS